MRANAGTEEEALLSGAVTLHDQFPFFKRSFSVLISRILCPLHFGARGLVTVTH